MENSLLYGSNQNGRNMKKNKKEDLVLNSLKKSSRALKKAQEVAEYNKDIEALIVISERWMNLSQLIKSLDKPKQQMLGFTSMTEEEDIDE